MRFKLNSFRVRFRNIIFIICISVVSTFSCKENRYNFIDEGEIHYKVEYLGSRTLLPKELMPQNMVVSFKNDNTLFELLSPFGNSGISNLSNPSKDIHDTYLSLFTIKYVYPLKPGEVYPGFESMNGMEIKKTSKTAVICGLNCENAVVTLASDKSKTFNIWYTKEIPLKNPNASTPYQEIDGVLMSFYYFIGEAEFYFEAENIYRKDIPDESFERRAKFREVSKEDITKFITKMVSL
jgi:hypothetical protein